MRKGMLGKKVVLVERRSAFLIKKSCQIIMKKIYVIASTLLCLMCLSGNIMAKSGYYKYQPIIDTGELQLSEECYTKKDNNMKNRAICKVDGIEKFVDFYMEISKKEYQEIKDNLNKESILLKVKISSTFVLGILLIICCMFLQYYYM